MAFTQNISQLLQNSVDYEGNRLSLKQLSFTERKQLVFDKEGETEVKDVSKCRPGDNKPEDITALVACHSKVPFKKSFEFSDDDYSNRLIASAKELVQPGRAELLDSVALKYFNKNQAVMKAIANNQKISDIKLSHKNVDFYGKKGILNWLLSISRILDFLCTLNNDQKGIVHVLYGPTTKAGLVATRKKKETKKEPVKPKKNRAKSSTPSTMLRPKPPLVPPTAPETAAYSEEFQKKLDIIGLERNKKLEVGNTKVMVGGLEFLLNVDDDDKLVFLNKKTNLKIWLSKDDNSLRVSLLNKYSNKVGDTYRTFKGDKKKLNAYMKTYADHLELFNYPKELRENMKTLGLDVDKSMYNQNVVIDGSSFRITGPIGGDSFVFTYENDPKLAELPDYLKPKIKLYKDGSLEVSSFDVGSSHPVENFEAIRIEELATKVKTLKKYLHYKSVVDKITVTPRGFNAKVQIDAIEFTNGMDDSNRLRLAGKYKNLNIEINATKRGRAMIEINKNGERLAVRYCQPGEIKTHGGNHKGVLKEMIEAAMHVEDHEDILEDGFKALDDIKNRDTLDGKIQRAKSYYEDQDTFEDFNDYVKRQIIFYLYGDHLQKGEYDKAFEKMYEVYELVEDDPRLAEKAAKEIYETFHKLPSKQRGKRAKQYIEVTDRFMDLQPKK
jgi:hypothetical protein